MGVDLLGNNSVGFFGSSLFQNVFSISSLNMLKKKRKGNDPS